MKIAVDTKKRKVAILDKCTVSEFIDELSEMFPDDYRHFMIVDVSEIYDPFDIKDLFGNDCLANNQSHT